MAKKKSKQEGRTLSAQVLLRPASGREVAGDTVITTETLEQYLPSPEVAERVRVRYSRAGFEVGPVVGNSFSITAPASKFEQALHTKVREAGKGAVEFAGGPELSPEALPRELAEDVATVTFTPPPDFGPASY